MPSKQSIALIGPMGSGKTSVGRRLACVLKRDFFDSDHEIVARTGVSIDHIFDVEGEEGFRERETNILSELVKIPNLVISTGGGIVTRENNRKLLKKNTLVIYLSSSVEQIIQRTQNSNKRPLLENTKDRKKTIIKIVNERNPWYQETADVTIDTSGKKLYVIINEIKKILNNEKK